MISVTHAYGPSAFALAVRDRHPYRPALPGSPAAAPGSGLAMVAEKTMGLGGTAVVGADADGRGKAIWITLPL